MLPLPKRAARAFLANFGVDDKKCVSLTSKEWEILSRLKRYRFAPAGTFGYSKAEVTKGGVDISEIEPESMMSRLERNLYFIGEVLDITGYLGGYNFQWAFSSAVVCAEAIKDSYPKPIC